MKIKVMNYQNNSYQQKNITTEIGTVNQYLIGRHPNCDLVLNSPEVSRVHGVIYACDRSFYFVDLASSDGSRINNQELEVNQSYLLKSDDIIHIGDFLLLVEDINADGETNTTSVTTTATTATVQSTTNWSHTVRCVRVVEETPDVKTFTFVSEPTVNFSYEPGQFVTLELEINGKMIKRPYSISSTPSRPHSLEITVKRATSPTNSPDAPAGLVSNWLHDNLQPGSQIKIGNPLGDFSCIHHPSSKILFISAGSGITPMMSMSRWLLDTSAGCDIVFFHSARTQEDIIYQRELELMASRYTNFQLIMTLTRQRFNTSPWGMIGRFSKSLLKEIVPDFAERTVYVCGSQPFTKEVKTAFEELEFPMENYYQESFGNPKGNKKTQPEQPKNQDNHQNNHQENAIATSQQVKSATSTTAIVLSKSGVEIPCDRDDTILEIAENEGISLPHMCRMGACQKCKLRLLEGEVNYEDDPDCPTGHILTCIAKPVGRVVIEG